MAAIRPKARGGRFRLNWPVLKFGLAIPEGVFPP